MKLTLLARTRKRGKDGMINKGGQFFLILNFCFHFLTESLEWRSLNLFFSFLIFDNSDLYLCDLFWVRRAGFENFDLLVHVGRVHPLCSTSLFVGFIEASEQSLKWAKKSRQKARLRKKSYLKQPFSKSLEIWVRSNRKNQLFNSKPNYSRMRQFLIKFKKKPTQS